MDRINIMLFSLNRDWLQMRPPECCFRPGIAYSEMRLPITSCHYYVKRALATRVKKRPHSGIERWHYFLFAHLSFVQQILPPMPVRPFSTPSSNTPSFHSIKSQIPPSKRNNLRVLNTHSHKLPIRKREDIIRFLKTRIKRLSQRHCLDGISKPRSLHQTKSLKQIQLDRPLNNHIPQPRFHTYLDRPEFSPSGRGQDRSVMGDVVVASFLDCHPGDDLHLSELEGACHGAGDERYGLDLEKLHTERICGFKKLDPDVCKCEPGERNWDARMDWIVDRVGILSTAWFGDGCLGCGWLCRSVLRNDGWLDWANTVGQFNVHVVDCLIVDLCSSTSKSANNDLRVACLQGVEGPCQLIGRQTRVCELEMGFVEVYGDVSEGTWNFGGSRDWEGDLEELGEGFVGCSEADGCSVWVGRDIDSWLEVIGKRFIERSFGRGAIRGCCSISRKRLAEEVIDVNDFTLWVVGRYEDYSVGREDLKVWELDGERLVVIVRLLGVGDRTNPSVQSEFEAIEHLYAFEADGRGVGDCVSGGEEDELFGDAVVPCLEVCCWNVAKETHCCEYSKYGDVVV